MKNQKLKSKKRKKPLFYLYFLFIFSLSFFIFDFCYAAILYSQTDQNQYYSGDTFNLEIRIDPQLEYINAVKVDLNFDSNLLEARDFDSEDSILSFWIEESDLKTANQEGKISFSGGIPGGFNGKFIGTPFQANLLAKIKFKVKKECSISTTTSICFLESSEVRLNNGRGSKAHLTIKENLIKLLPETEKKNQKNLSFSQQSSQIFYPLWGLLQEPRVLGYNIIMWKIEPL